MPVAILLGAFLAYQFFHLTPRYLKLLLGLGFVGAVLRLPLARSLGLFCIIFPAPTFIYAEGMARPDVRDGSLAAARQTIEQLALR